MTPSATTAPRAARRAVIAPLLRRALPLTTLAVLSLGGCARTADTASAPPSSPGAGSTSSSSDAPSDASATDTNETSAFERGMQQLPVEGHEDAVVFVPDGDGPWPLIMATHGAGGLAEFDCHYWRELTDGRAFVSCPRGKPRGQGNQHGYYYPDEHALEREVAAVRAAVLARYGEHVDEAHATYAGFSQGAILGVNMFGKRGGEYPYLVLIEGGYDYWSPKRARDFKQTGGKRVLFACGTKTCDQGSRDPHKWIGASGAEARVEMAAGSGHTPLGGVVEKVRSALPWLWSDQPSPSTH